MDLFNKHICATCGYRWAGTSIIKHLMGRTSYDDIRRLRLRFLVDHMVGKCPVCRSRVKAL